MTGKRNKYFAIFLMVIVVLSLFTGCGKSSNKTNTTQEKSQEKAEATAQDATQSVNTSGKRVDEDGFTVIDDYVVTTANKVNIRKSPSTDGEIYIELLSGVNLRRTGYNDEWSRVKLNGSEFYVYSKYVKNVEIEWSTAGEPEINEHIVYIDAAKQIMVDTETEPVSPDCEDEEEPVEKAKSGASSIGVSSKKLEYEVNLEIARVLEEELKRRGYTVVMSRETNDVNLSNKQRAENANISGAEIYIRIQSSSTGNSDKSGIMGIITTSANSSSGKYYTESYKLCNLIINEICSNTGANRVGIYETDNMTTINWCEIPIAVINVGFLSNRADDESLNDYTYQNKLAQYISDGIDKYFGDEGDKISE